MFKLLHFKMLCIKRAHFKFDVCYRSHNSWDGGMFSMLQHLLFLSKQFEDVWASRLWVSGVLVLNLISFLPDVFQLLKSSWSMTSLNMCYVLYVLLWIKYWLMWFDSLLVFILFKFKKRPKMSGIRGCITLTVFMIFNDYSFGVLIFFIL